MLKGRWLCWIALVTSLSATVVPAQQMGGIRGTVYDKDLNVPLALAHVRIVETDQKTTTSDEGNYVFNEVQPGKYTLVFWKEKYARQVKSDVVVEAGQMTEVDASLSGEFEEMEEFVVQELKIGGAEVELMKLRDISPAFVDSISDEWMSLAGVSDAASALRLVSGTTVQEGKYAVVRGLPDRYVNSQMNSVRLPTADPDKRAVQLDQFPSDVIDNIQVSKTFTPDQQGDASGGAVNVILKGIPKKNTFKISTGSSINTQTINNDRFLTYDGGGLNFLGIDDGQRDIQYENEGGIWDGAVGVSRRDSPYNYDFAISGGLRHEFDAGLTVGGFSSFYYDRDNSYHGDAKNYSYWLEPGRDTMTPQYGGDDKPGVGAFQTSLYDVKEASQELKWGWLGAVGAETKNHQLNLVYMHTRVTEDKAILAEDTTGKASLHKYWPQHYGPEYANYAPYDENHPGNDDWDNAPYLRTESLNYSERTTETLQLTGRHTLAIAEFGIEDLFMFKYPEFDWTLASSSSGMYEPDKRLFGTMWRGPYLNPGFPSFGIPPFLEPAEHRKFKPDANFNMGNLQRTWKTIEEKSDQYFYNIKFPFEQWDGEEGYVKLGVFEDKVERTYDQESFSNFGLINPDSPNSYQAPWEDYWSEVWLDEEHNIGAGEIDVDYEGKQDISASYYMIDMPLATFFNVIGGARYENTNLSIVTDPEADVKWIRPDGLLDNMDPGEADVSFKQEDVLPSLGFVFEPFEEIKFRGSWSRTIARQTFKELSPIQQQEFLGGEVFVGNPSLQMSAVENYDLRFDYTPYKGGLISASWFHKDIENPIEYVQRGGSANFTYTTPINYPQGELTGFEFEVRQRLGQFWDKLEGLSAGGNATFIDSQVTLPQEEFDLLESVGNPIKTRHMTNAPQHLYNLYLTYDWERYDTRIGLFYTVRGDTLVAGAGQTGGNFVPSLYEREYGTLNLTVAKKLGEYAKLSFKAKNLLNPKIQQVYRSDYIGDDVVKTSYQKGIEFSLGLSVEF